MPQINWKLLERELNTLKSDMEPFTLKISDLVMMQMTGRLDELIAAIPNRRYPSTKPLEELIQKTKEEVTTPNLFREIVRKTIQAQMGERHAMLRELGQNGRDAYSPDCNEKTVEFIVEHDDNGGLKLIARDCGLGMDINTIVRDLLIPYNSTKEFDPTKIGEHGIGWWSIADVAELVKVVSKTQYNERSNEVLIYQDKVVDGKVEWNAVIQPEGRNAYASRDEHGTEVTAFIPSNLSSFESIREHLYKYLGWMDSWDVKLILKHGDSAVQINSISEEYKYVAEKSMKIGNETGKLRFAVSKRNLKGTSDERYWFRDNNLDKIVFTQHGQFIRYEDCQFQEETIHKKLFDSLKTTGLDFWVDVPGFITQTKGRNNIIADHKPAVIEAMYEPFEKLFIDHLVNDPSVLYHSKGYTACVIADLFSGSTKDQLVPVRSSKNLLAGLDSLVSSIEVAARNAGAFFIEKSEYAVHDLPVKVGNGIQHCGARLKGLPSDIAASVSAGIASATKNPIIKIRENLHYIAAPLILGSAAYLGYSAASPYFQMIADYAYTSLSSAAVVTAVLAGSGAAAFGAVKYTPKALKALNNAFEKWKTARMLETGFEPLALPENRMIKVVQAQEDFTFEVKPESKEDEPFPTEAKPKNLPATRPSTETVHVDLGLSSLVAGLIGIGRNVREGATKCGRYALDKVKYSVGLPYYLTRWAGEKLFEVLNLYQDVEGKRQEKKIAKQKEVFSKYMSRIEQDRFLSRIMKQRIIPARHYETIVSGRKIKVLDDSLWSLLGFGPLYKEVDSYYGKAEVKIDDEEMLSIEELVNLMLQGKVGCTSDVRAPWSKDKTYFVNFTSNQIAATIKDKLRGIERDLPALRDIKVAEDYLNHLGAFAKNAALLLYGMTPIGWTHAIVTELRGTNSPFEDFHVYKSGRDLAVRTRDSICEFDVQQKLYNTATAVKEFGGNCRKALVATVEAFCSGVSELAGIVFEDGVKPLGYLFNPLNYGKHACKVRNFVGNEYRILSDGLKSAKQERQKKRLRAIEDKKRRQEVKRLEDNKRKEIAEARAKKDKEKSDKLRALREEHRKLEARLSEAKGIENDAVHGTEEFLSFIKSTKNALVPSEPITKRAADKAHTITEYLGNALSSCKGYFQEKSSKVSAYATDLFRDTTIFDLIADGVKGDATINSFDDLDVLRLEAITNRINAGQIYVDFMNFLKGIDEVLANALDKEPLKFSYKWKNDSQGTFGDWFSLSESNAQGFINLRETYLIRMYHEMSKGLEMNLFFHLVRQRVLSSYIKDSMNKTEALYTRKAVDYMIDNEINLREIMVDSYSENHGDLFYYISGVKLADCYFMTRRRLNKEYVEYEMERDREKAREEYMKRFRTRYALPDFSKSFSKGLMYFSSEKEI
ncbi:DUF1090 domain-containing protein [Candidatus Woesearchaeota archaeon]|nr:DUF1090 domain-containing protein [Candidatus Woesearchaeota archaeon]